MTPEGRSRDAWTGVVAFMLCAILLPAGPHAGLAQETAEIGRAPWSRMNTLLEKTFLKVDVLRLEVFVDDATAGEFQRIAAAGQLDGARGDSIVLAAFRGEQAGASIEFVRDLSLRQFLDGIDEDQRKAVASGFMDDSVYHAIRSSLPVWFSFLARRGIRDGDRITYVLEPDAIRTVYRDRDGAVLLDRRDTGRERRNSVLATWLAPGSSFRKGLLRSLQRQSRNGGLHPPIGSNRP